MAEIQTKQTGASVRAFLDGIEDAQRRRDAKALAKMMSAATGARGAMWGESIIGFGKTSYTYADGKANEWFQLGFSPRKRSFSLYVMDGFQGRSTLLKRLGKHKTGKACLYVDKLDDVDLAVLRALFDASVAAQDRSGR